MTTEPVTEQAEPTHEERMAEAASQFNALVEALPAGVTFSDLILASDLIGYERVGGRYNEQRDLQPVERTLNLRKSRIYTRWNPLVDRAVGLWTEMAFEEPWTYTAKDASFQRIIDEFQTFKRNRSVLSWIAAQGLSRDLLTDGEIPFVYFVGDDGVQVRAMDPIEFLDPVTNPNDKAEVWYWPRQWVGSDGKRHLWLYRDWNAVDDEGKPINQPVPEADRQRLQAAGAMAEVELTARPNEYLGMLAIKKSGLRGYPLMTSGFRYVKLHDDFMLDRASLTAERAKWAMKVTVNGGQAQVNQVRTAIERPDVATPSEGLRSGRAQTWISNPGVGAPAPVEAVNDGQSARQDERSLRMMATMPSGIPPHLMGDAGEANLASATATEKPLRAMLESYQGLWMEYRQEEFEHVAAWLGFTGDTSVDIDAPVILGQSLLELSQIVASIAGTFPAVKRSEEMLGFLLTELGINNVDDVIDTLRPYLEDDLEAEEQSALKQAEEALREARKART